MKRSKRTAVTAAGLVVACAAALPAFTLGAFAADNSPSLQSFSAAKAASAYELSAPGMTDGGLEIGLSPSLSAGELLPGAGATSFVTSTILSPQLALDSGAGIDVASRFTASNDGLQPFLSAVSAPFLSLANGSRYSGFTFVPAPNLRLRAGVAINSERLDEFRFDPGAPPGPLTLTYDASQSNSLLAGLSWDVSSALGLNMSAISAQRSGIPMGLSEPSVISPKAATQALGVAAHVDIGQGWVTTASLSEGLTQLDQRVGSDPANLHEQSYSLAIAKQGLFGDDALGLSFSRPTPSMVSPFATGFTASGDLAPVIMAQSLNGSRAATENDFQLGYITNFLDGAVALQTNAAYQTNFQGQPGVTSVSLLSRAKIKF